MSTSAGAVSVSLTGRSDGFTKAVGAAVASLSTLSSAAARAMSSVDMLGKAGKKFESAMNMSTKKVEAMDSLGSRVGVMGAAVSAALGAAGYSAVKAASNFEESTNVMQQAFGPATSAMEAWASDTGAAMSRSTQQMRQYVGTLQAMLVPMVGSHDVAQTMSKDISKLAVDMASFWNVADDDAMIALKSALSGEIEPMRRFGVNLTEASLGAYALEKGISASLESMSYQQKVLLRYQMIMDRTTAVQGDAVRTAGSFANSSKALSSAIENLAVSMGNVLLPAATGVVRGLTEIVKLFDGMSSTSKNAIVTTGAVAAGLGALATAGGGSLVILATIIRSYKDLLTLAPGVAAGIKGIGVAFQWVLGPLAAFAAAYTITSALIRDEGDKPVSMLDAMSSAIDSATSSWDEFKAMGINALGAVLVGIQNIFDKINGTKLSDDLGSKIADWAGRVANKTPDDYEVKLGIALGDKSNMEFVSDIENSLAETPIDVPVDPIAIEQAQNTLMATPEQQKKFDTEKEAAAKRYTAELERQNSIMESLADINSKIARDHEKMQTGAFGEMLSAGFNYQDSLKELANASIAAGGTDISSGKSKLQDLLVSDMTEAFKALDLSQMQQGIEEGARLLNEFGASTDQVNSFVSAATAEYNANAAAVAGATKWAQELSDIDMQIEAASNAATMQSPENVLMQLFSGGGKTEMSAAQFDQLGMFAQAGAAGLQAGASGGAMAGIGSAIMTGFSSAAGPVGMLVAQTVGSTLMQLLQPVFDAASSLFSEIASAFGNEKISKATSTGGNAAIVAYAVFAPIAAAFLPLGGVLGALTLVVGGALTAFAAVFGFLFSLSQSTKSFQDFQNAIEYVVQGLVDRLEPFWGSFTSLIGLFDVASQALVPFINAFNEFAGPLSNVLFESLKILALALVGLAIGVTFVTNVFFGMVSAIAGLLEELFRVQHEAIKAAGGVGDAQFMLWDSTEDLAKSMQVDTGSLQDTFGELMGLTYEEASARGETITQLAKENELRESILNAPQGLKVAAARMNAIDAEATSGNGSGSVTSRSTAPATSTTVNIGVVELAPTDMDDFIDQVKEAAEHLSYRETGGPGGGGGGIDRGGGR